MSLKFVGVSVTLIVSLLLSGCAGGLDAAPAGATAGTRADHFAATATIKDDALEVSAVFSTEKGLQERRGLMGIVTEDQFLRAFHDKRSGARRYQVYVALTYKSDLWREPFEARYGTPLQTRSVARVMRQSDCKDRRKIDGCIRVEHVVFELAEAEFLRAAEATQADLETKVWDFKLKTKDGKDYVGTLPFAEFAGLARAMRAHKLVATR